MASNGIGSLTPESGSMKNNPIRLKPEQQQKRERKLPFLFYGITAN
jgi:hypothetical protein